MIFYTKKHKEMELSMVHSIESTSRAIAYLESKFYLCSWHIIGYYDHNMVLNCRRATLKFVAYGRTTIWS